MCGRYNKLGLDATEDDDDTGRVAEVHQLTRVTSEPLSKLQIVSAALGHTHSAVVTGQTSSAAFIRTFNPLNPCSQ